MVRTHNDPEPRRFASIWSDGGEVAMMLFESEGKSLKPLFDWRSKIQPLDFNFSRQIDLWEQQSPVTKVLVNQIPDFEDAKHPFKRVLKGRSTKIEPSISVVEGMMIFQEATEEGLLTWDEYAGYGRLQEQMKRGLKGTPDFLLMAFLQGLVHRPRFETFSTEIGTVEPYNRNRYGSINFTGWL